MSHQARYPKGAVDQAISALEAVRPDYSEGALLTAVDDALDRLYRVREIEEGIAHPCRPQAAMRRTEEQTG